MGVNSLPKTVIRQRRNCDLNPGPSAPESSTLTTRLPSYPRIFGCHKINGEIQMSGYANTMDGDSGELMELMEEVPVIELCESECRRLVRGF